MNVENTGRVLRQQKGNKDTKGGGEGEQTIGAATCMSSFLVGKIGPVQKEVKKKGVIHTKKFATLDVGRSFEKVSRLRAEGGKKKHDLKEFRAQRQMTAPGKISNGAWASKLPWPPYPRTTSERGRYQFHLISQLKLAAKFSTTHRNSRQCSLTSRKQHSFCMML